MRIYNISLILNGILFVLALMYSMLRYQQKSGNVQGKSEEYKRFKYLIILFFLICVIPEIQSILNLNLESLNSENIDNGNYFYDVLPILISNGLFFTSCIVFIPKLISNHSNEIQLPYPSRYRAKQGQIEMGRIKFKNKKKYKFNLAIGDLERHMFICGSTGSGKTNFHQRFLINLDRILDVPFMLCEFKGEYTFMQGKIKNLLVLKPGYNFFINIFDPVNMNPRVHAERLFQAFRSGMKFEDKEFSPQMERLFVDILIEMCNDDKKRDWDAFQKLSKDYFSKNSLFFNNIEHLTGGSVEQSIYAIQNRMRRYCTGTLSEIFVKKIGMNVEDIFNHKVIVDLSSIINLGGDKVDALFFLNMLLKYLYDENIKRGGKDYRGIRHITILEDAQYFAPQQLSKKSEITTYIEDIALLLRGTGECLITLATRPALSKEILANCGVLISFKEYMQKDLLHQLLNLENNQERYLSELELGQCIVRVNSIERPFSLVVPYMKREELNDDEITQNNIKVLKSLDPGLKLHSSFQNKEENIPYCQYCGYIMKSTSEDKTCGICNSYFKDVEKQNALRKIYDEFRDVIEDKNEFERIFDKKNKEINGVS